MKGWKRCKFCRKKIEHIANKHYCSGHCRYEAKKLRAPRYMTPDLRKFILERDNYTCQYCRATAEEVDHIKPVSKGGNDDKENLAAACWECNHVALDRDFDCFNHKQDWILKKRKIILPVIEKKIERPIWHAWVYGGSKNPKL